MSDNTNTLGDGGMTIFDTLPRPLREALANHPDCMDAQHGKTLIDHGRDLSEIISMLNAARGIQPTREQYYMERDGVQFTRLERKGDKLIATLRNGKKLTMRSAA